MRGRYDRSHVAFGTFPANDGSKPKSMWTKRSRSSANAHSGHISLVNATYEQTLLDRDIGGVARRR